MSFLGIAPTPPRVSELWEAIKPRLDTVRMQSILGGTGRIVRVDQDLSPYGAETAAWARCVIVPVRRIYGEPAEGAGRNRDVRFLLRTEVHAPSGDTAYNPGIAAEAAQGEGFAQLHGWVPTGFTYARVVGAISRETAPQSLPLWDDQTGLWYLSAEYRAWLAPV
jgi:hypothetical protein